MTIMIILHAGYLKEQVQDISLDWWYDHAVYDSLDIVYLTGIGHLVSSTYPVCTQVQEI